MTGLALTSLNSVSKCAYKKCQQIWNQQKIKLQHPKYVPIYVSIYSRLNIQAI